MKRALILIAIFLLAGAAGTALGRWVHPVVSITIVGVLLLRIAIVVRRREPERAWWLAAAAVGATVGGIVSWFLLRAVG